MRKLRFTSKVVFLISIVFWAFNGEAQTGKIRKIKGNRAIVDFPNSAQISEGQQVSVSSSKGGGGERARNHGLAYRTGYLSSKPASGGAETKTILAQIEYGYNLSGGKSEIGGWFDYTNTEAAGAKSTIMSFGPFYRFNFTANQPGATTVPYISLGLTIDSTESGSSKLAGTTIKGAGGVSWFPFAQIFAVDFALQYEMATLEANGVKRETTDLNLLAGWKIYF